MSGGIASTDLTMTLDGTRTMKEAPNSSTKAKSFQSRISAFSLASAVRFEVIGRRHQTRVAAALRWRCE